MKPSAHRRADYRRTVVASGQFREDRFTEMMRAVIAGGSRPCACCSLVRPVAVLNERGLCATCESSLGKLRQRPPTPRPPTEYMEAGVVYVDASYGDGIAGLAIVGALGEHSRKAEATSSTHAETLALRWAMEIARRGRVTDLTFRTDCQAAFKVLCQTPVKWRWTVQQVPRYQNMAADRMASYARLAAELPGRGPTPSTYVAAM